MDQWISTELSEVLGFPVPDDMIQYILSIDDEPDFNDYMKTLLDFSNPSHKSFFVELAKKKFPNKGPPTKQKKKISKSNKPQPDFVTFEGPANPPKPEDSSQTQDAHEETGKKKKKTKFVNLYSNEGKNAQVVMLKGRHVCDCEASQHELINNCLECGRIVCAQEGSGPCMFCGALVCTEEEELKMTLSEKDNGKKGSQSMLQRDKPDGWAEALAQRDRLLDYERNSEKRTVVLDDDCDYFNTNSVWLKPEEREKLEQYQQELQEKKHASRLASRKMTFDFAGRQLVEDKSSDHAVDLDKIRNITIADASRPKQEFRNDMNGPPLGDVDYAAMTKMLCRSWQAKPQLVNTRLAESPITSERQSQGLTLEGSRIQDGDIHMLIDNGRCLSMHQPWASLLVEGIKIHEGRSWYSNHRGRLWIASTAKPPDPDDVRSLEAQYRAMYPDEELKFPSFYPTGCLLGCVDVVDCLTQEEYRKQYPDGESDSPYVFICSNPQSLKLRFPIKGQHKIYSLDKTIHIAAKKCILTMQKEKARQAMEQS